MLALDDEGGDKIGPEPTGSRASRPSSAALRQAAIDRGAYTMQNIVTGDGAKGKACFTANGASCHSPTGDLAGIAGNCDPVALQVARP